MDALGFLIVLLGSEVDQSLREATVNTQSPGILLHLM